MARARLFALIVLGASCRAAPTPPAQNLVLVTIDTLRADRLGCYGSRTVETPHLDAIAREGGMAVEAMCHVPLTRPSHTSILTGLYPADHGLRDNVSPSLDERIPTLATILGGAGLETGAFVSSIVLSAQSGLNRGFSTYSDRFEVDPNGARFLNQIQRRGDKTTAEALDWLGTRKGRFFLWLHLYDPHEPYEPPEPYASRYAERPYDGAVAWSDELVGRLDAKIHDLALESKTLLVVTSDHGEGLGEHGESVHGFFVYQTTLRVPLLLRGPGIVAGTRLPVTARSVDIAPTVLDLLGLHTQARLSGRSLARAFTAGEVPAEEGGYAESLLPLVHYGWSDLRTLREGRWKYILAPHPELYDLQSDPSEGTNLASKETARADGFRSALEQRLSAERSAAPAAGGGGIPADLLEKLGALGYVGAGASPGVPSGADPKDKIEEFKVLNRLVREGILALRAKEYAGSVARFQELLGRGVDSFEVHYYLARALVGLGRTDPAAEHFAVAIARFPSFSQAYRALADCRVARKDYAGALDTLKKGEAAAPEDSDLPKREAEILRHLGRNEEARSAFERAMAVSPRDPLPRVELAEMLRDQHQLETSLALLREAVALDPETSSYWNSLGLTLAVKGDFVEAERAFREAARIEPGNPEYAYNTGLALLRGGRGEEAKPLFQKALEVDPRFLAAKQRLAEIR